MEKNIEKFMKMIPLLEEVEFMGLCKILTVSPITEEKEVKEFSSIIEEILVKFNEMNRHNRRELLRILEKATKDRSLEQMTNDRKNRGADVVNAADHSEVDNEVK